MNLFEYDKEEEEQYQNGLAVCLELLIFEFQERLLSKKMSVFRNY